MRTNKVHYNADEAESTKDTSRIYDCHNKWAKKEQRATDKWK